VNEKIFIVVLILIILFLCFLLRAKRFRSTKTSGDIPTTREVESGLQDTMDASRAESRELRDIITSSRAEIDASRTESRELRDIIRREQHTNATAEELIQEGKNILNRG
jgi:hypothetical protein